MTSNQSSRLNATVINIHSPDNQTHSPELDSQRRPSANSNATRQAPAKPSPKVEEYRKMIQHIINKIVKRKRPPTALFHLSEYCRTTEVTDQFDNDDTIDLLIQLRSALLVCHNVGLSGQVLMQGERTPTASPVSSRTNSPAHSPRLGSPSRSAEGVSSALPNIVPKIEKKTDFETILHVLSDLVLNDSRFKTANPKPSRPPFTMQTILIDIALLLVQIRDDSAGLYNIGSTFLPAFEAFSNGTLLGKLLSLYLDNLLPKLMKCKDETKSQGEFKSLPKTDNKSHLIPPLTQNTPTINIQSPEPEVNNVPLKLSQLTIDTRPYSADVINPSSPLSPSALSTHSSMQGQTIENYHAYALFTPLLFFMIQYLDPYLAAQPNKSQQENLTHTLTSQANSIHNFHRALSYMMSCKPDLYLDILQVISHSTPEVKFRACQILMYYYFESAGHIMVADPLPLLGTREELEVLDQRREQQEFEENRQNPQKRHPVNLTRQQSVADSLADNAVEDDHVWYPHIFDCESQDNSLFTDNPIKANNTLNTSATNDELNEVFCRECFKTIKGFGLKCFPCKDSIHYNCSSAVTDMKEQGIMFYVKSGGIQKLLTPQFCPIPSQPRFRDMVNRGILGWTAKSNSTKVCLLGHTFSLVNLYTIMICACCGMPLWGVSQQGYNCTDCNRFIHPHCLAEAEETNSFSGIKCQKKPSLQQFQACVPYQPLLESDIQIFETDLAKNLSEFYGDALPLNEESLEGRGFEEVSTILNTLLLQENILHNGIAAGCILISRDSNDPLSFSPVHHHYDGSISPQKASASNWDERLPHCGMLTKSTNLCKAYISSGKCKGSTFLDDFYGDQPQGVYECILSKEEYLGHLSAMMKCLKTSFVNNNFAATALPSINSDKRRSAGDSRGFLQVSPNPFTAWEDEDEDFTEGNVPNEHLDRSIILSWVMTNLNFKSRKAAEIILQHMRNLGLFERFDAAPILFNLEAAKQEDKAIQCIFPVPYAIDCSANVESLINAIDASLQDIDLSINECGLSLLTRRCSPDPFMSSYTTERLVHAIVSWTFDEDERLLALHAELTSGNKSSNNQHKKHHNRRVQAALLARIKGGHNVTGDRQQQNAYIRNKTGGLSSGASSNYVTIRAALRDRYVVRWMKKVHDMDTVAYTEMLFNAMDSIIDNNREDCAVPNWGEPNDTKKHVMQKYEQFISYIMKLKTNNLTFSSTDSLLQKWLDTTYTEFSVLGILEEKEPVDIRHLVKLCSSRSSSKPIGLQNSVGESTHPIEMIIAQFNTGDKESIDRGMRWLTLVTHSGTGIPANSLAQIARLIVAARTPLSIIAEFTKLVWFQAVNITNVSTPRGAVIDVIGYLNDISMETLTEYNENQALSEKSLTSAQTFIKYSAALACYAYNCPLDSINELEIVPHTGNHISQLTQNKRSTHHVENSLLQADENTPLIKCMLAYLQYDQLNVREDIVKLFYALSHWGYGIENKDEFIKQCMPQLISSVWELLTPAYDYFSNTNLALLMKLISIDVRYFQACVFKIFEDANWEVRYQGLDNLFGLFTKMDAAFQTEWLKLLSHLGPVFSYFVGCLWDKEEYVRSKAYALIRTFGTLHLRSAFRCWEAYFLTATDRQRMSLVSLMIQLNALFPEWQVLQWESLLEALEIKTPVDILDEFTRPISNDHEFLKGSNNIHDNDGNQRQQHYQQQQSAESENVKVLMLTLALQMLSNHLSIEIAQIYRLKFILVQLMDFQNCQFFNDGGEISIDFGLLKYNPKDPTRVAVMVSCIRGLKKIMDSFAPLPAETVATLASDSIEQNKVNLSENSSPGVHFIDVVLKMVNSGLDLIQLGHMMLKAWLEIILIVVYKHNILEREYEQNIVSCMKQIIDLLTEEISEENKLLILEILKCLLRRSDHLTAMVLSKQILALGKLMTRSGIKNSEPVFLKAKQFLKSAFLRFAVAGLFVLMFKNQAVTDTDSSDVDLFFVLRTVIDQDDVIPDEDFRGEIIYLRDQPVRDVLDKLMKQQMERKAFSTVLHNTSRYVETVHTHPYSENILNDYAVFINALIKHTLDWRRSDWNINPIFTMSAILLKEHPYHHSILLPAIQAIFKHGLQNCVIQPENVAQLIIAYSGIATMPGTPPGNVFVEMIIEELKNNFASNFKPNKDTFLALLELVLWDTKPSCQVWYNKIETSILGETIYGYNHPRFFQGKMLPLSRLLVNHLKRVPTSQQFTKKDFKVYSCTIQLLVSMCISEPKQMPIILGYLKINEQTECLRFLNWLILTLLKEKSDLLMFNMLAYEITITELIVKVFNTIEIDFHTSDLNFSFSGASEKLLLGFLLLKSYVLLKSRTGISNHSSLGDKSQVINPISFWLSIWPAIRRLLEMIEPSTLFMAGNVGISVWSMFLSLLQFLFTSRSEIVMINAFEWTDVLNSLLNKLNEHDQNVPHQDNGGTDHIISLSEFRDQAEKLKEMFSIPPIEVPAETMINQLYLEIRDIMRLQAESITVQGNNRVLLQTAYGDPH